LNPTGLVAPWLTCDLSWLSRFEAIQWTLQEKSGTQIPRCSGEFSYPLGLSPYRLAALVHIGLIRDGLAPSSSVGGHGVCCRERMRNFHHDERRVTDHGHAALSAKL
jgi:hypothetical protein